MNLFSRLEIRRAPCQSLNRASMDQPAPSIVCGHRSGSLRHTTGGRETALDVGDNVVDVLNTDGQANVAVRHPGRALFLGRKLRMRRARRMDREAAGVADIGDVIEELQGIDEPPSGLDAAREFETDQTAVAALEIAICT